MSRIEKLRNKFFEKPIPNDITFAEAVRLSKWYGCEMQNRGKHVAVCYRPLGRIITIPRHGNTVKEAYIKELKELFEEIELAR